MPDAQIEALTDAVRAKGPLERVLIRDGAQVHVLPVERIDYVEAQDDYVCFDADGRQYLKDQTLAAVEAPARSRAVRPHPSLVPPQHRADRAGRAVREGQPGRDPARRPRLPVSRAGYARLAKLL